MSHTVVSYRYLRHKGLNMLQRWETKQVFFFILMENWGPEMTDHLTKVTPEVCSKAVMWAAGSHAVLTLSWPTFRNLARNRTGCYFKETQLKKCAFLNWESSQIFSVLLCCFLRCAGCNRLGLFNPVACGPFMERKTMPEWLEHLKVVNSCNGDYCAQSKGSKQLSHKSCFKTSCTNFLLVCALPLTT